MFIKNWMRKDPLTISSDLNARDALKILEEKKLPFIPVVDDGKLRGILTRRDARGAASSVTATQSIHEMNFFNNRLKVKDLMVRKPLIVSTTDTIETALKKGSDMGRSFFPVVDGDRVVGTVCDRDFKDALNQILGVDESLCGVTLEGDGLKTAVITDIVSLIDRADASISSLFTLKDPASGKKRLLIRIKTENLKAVVDLLNEKGYRVVEVNEGGR